MTAAAEDSTAMSGKRKRWGADDLPSSSLPPPLAVSATPVHHVSTSGSTISDAVAAALAAPIDAYGKRLKPSSSASAAPSSNDAVSKKIWIPVDKNPGFNYIGLLIGPGGSKQRELVQESGGGVKISIRGRGSSSSSSSSTPTASTVVTGAPEEPLHVLLEGSTESVAKAERLIQELLYDSHKAQLEKDRQLGIVNSTKNNSSSNETSLTHDGTTSTSSITTTTSTYQPKPVAQLLGLTTAPQTSIDGTDSGQRIEEKIGIPNGFVGYIIGKGGETITTLQRKTACRVRLPMLTWCHYVKRAHG